MLKVINIKALLILLSIFSLAFTLLQISLFGFIAYGLENLPIQAWVLWLNQHTYIINFKVEEYILDSENIYVRLLYVYVFFISLSIISYSQLLFFMKKDMFKKCYLSKISPLKDILLVIFCVLVIMMAKITITYSVDDNIKIVVTQYSIFESLLLSPACEELVFRGLLIGIPLIIVQEYQLGSIAKMITITCFTLLSVFLDASIHHQYGSYGMLCIYISFIIISIFYILKRNIVMSIGLHSLLNLFTYVVYLG